MFPESRDIRALVIAATGRTGGAERYIARLYGGLATRGIHGSLLGELPEWQQTGLMSLSPALGPKWEPSTLPTGLVRLPLERRRVARAIGRLDFDLTHMHFKREQVGLTDIASRRGPVIWTEHGRLSQSLYGRAMGKAYRRAAERVAAITCVSALVADSVRDVVHSNVRVEVIENSVDTQQFTFVTEAERHSARESLAIQSSKTIASFVGRLVSSKRPLLARRLIEDVAGTLLVAGDGPESRSLNSGSSEGSIRLLGDVPDPRIVYQASDVLLFLSDGSGEGFPTVLLEAAACGVPVVGTEDCGFASEIEAAGGVVAAPTVRALKEGMQVVLDDRDRRASVAREWALDHDSRGWLDEHVRLFVELVGR
ncbi:MULTISPECIES: glycosyltransferase family 4 protein [unclassified Blastococcus]|uniref:glycosyltransferase family 4 protein n=1 Tax=unclassified Blastococcus TaxID=2619396 RepID=UPI001EEFF148|nr:MULTISPECIES: glycosyltransferase family 4 protein [unclassified Blastococcus]